MSPGMVTVCTCWVVILLTTFPSRAFVGRHLPVGPPASSAVQKAPGAVPEQVEDSRHEGSGGALQSTTLEDAGTQFQDSATPRPHRKILAGLKEVKKVKAAGDSIYGHRLLVGSSPPTCQGKCGSCNPCNPIHVSIGSPHGALTQQEYYPEVWRCKCGNRLFMP